MPTKYSHSQHLDCISEDNFKISLLKKTVLFSNKFYLFSFQITQRKKMHFLCLCDIAYIKNSKRLKYKLSLTGIFSDVKS